MSDSEKDMRERERWRQRYTWRESCSVRYDQKRLHVKGLKGESARHNLPHSEGRKQNGGNRENQ